MAPKHYVRQHRLLFESQLGVRLLFCGRYACTPSWSIPPEKLTSAMMSFFFVEKNACWSITNGQRLNLRQHDMQVSRGGDVLHMGHDPARPVTVLSIGLAIEQGVVPNILLQRKFARRYTIRTPQVYREKFDVILHALQSPLATRDWLVSSAVLQFLAYLLEETEAPLSAQAPGEDSVDRVLIAQAWANSHLGADLSLEQWAKAVGWHPVHFERVFKQQTGITPMRWITERRMEAARQYLSGTTKSVAEIAAALGYIDPFYFSRVFRRHFGQSPRHYRQTGLEFRTMT